MSDEAFNVYAAIGIGLTFVAAIASIIISIVSMRSSSRDAKRSGYLGTITASRDKWSNLLRENASLYFTQIARLCGGQENNLIEVFNELTRYHFAICLLIFKQDESLQNSLSAIRNKAFQLIDLNSVILSRYKDEVKALNRTDPNIESDNVIIQARKSMYDLRTSILNEYQPLAFEGIRELIEKEWRKQQYEATKM